MVGDYFCKLFSFGKIFKPKNQRSSKCSNKNNILHYISPWESNINALQSVLIWEKPEKSIIAIIIVNLIYWYLVYSDIQLYFGLSMFGLVSFLHHQWTSVIWPEISVPNVNADSEEWTSVHPKILSAPELSNHIKSVYKCIHEQGIQLFLLRRTHPGSFCAIAVCGFSLLWLVGYLVPGAALLYVLLMGTMTVPGILIHCVPEDLVTRGKALVDAAFAYQPRLSKDVDLSEFLLEESNADVQKALKIPLVLPDHDSPKSASSGTGSRGHASTSRKRKRVIDDSLCEGGSFIRGLSESAFKAAENDSDSDEADRSILRCFTETPRITSDFSDGEMSFVPGHFAPSDTDDDSLSRPGKSHPAGDSSTSSSNTAILPSLPAGDDSPHFYPRKPVPSKDDHCSSTSYSVPEFSSSDGEVDADGALSAQNVTALVMSYVQGPAVEHTTAFISDIGQRVANALAAAAADTTSPLTAAPLSGVVRFVPRRRFRIDRR